LTTAVSITLQIWTNSARLSAAHLELDATVYIFSD